MSNADLEIAQLRAENARLRRDLAQLRTLSSIAMEEPNPHLLAKRIAYEAALTLDTEQALVGFVKEDVVWVEAWVKNGVVHTLNDFWIEQGENAAGLVLLKRHPATVIDASSDPQITPAFREQFGCKSVLSVPMFDYQNEILGVIQWHNRNDGLAFGENDLPTAQAVAMQAAVAFERSRFFTRMQEWLTSIENLFAFNATLNEALTPALLVKRLVEHAAGFLHADGGLAGLFEGGKLISQGYWHTQQWLPINRTWGEHSDVPSYVTTYHCPYLTHDYSQDMLMDEQWKGKFGVTQALCVPIINTHNQVLGFFELHKGHTRTPFTWQDASFLESLANITAVALLNRQLLAELAAQREQITALSAQHVNWLEAERRHIARELHDETGQALIGIKLGLQALLQHIPTSQRTLRHDINELRTQVNLAAMRLKNMARVLRPPTLDELGLGAALEQLTHDFSERTGLHVQLQLKNEMRSPQEIETACYRIVQEALTNAAAHARAKQVHIEVAHANTDLILHIQDDGRGFDTSNIGKMGLGLLGMKERATMLGGAFEITSIRGRGTHILVKIPYHPARNDATATRAKERT